MSDDIPKIWIFEDSAFAEASPDMRRGTTLFAGYLDDSEMTAASFQDGWFRTGDLASRDADGRFRFAGHRSDVLRVSGESVSVVEVEAVVAEHPSVLEVAVLPRPDPVLDEVPFVGWGEERLAQSKRPHRLELIDELPRTSVGKIRKFLLNAASNR